MCAAVRCVLTPSLTLQPLEGHGGKSCMTYAPDLVHAGSMGDWMDTLFWIRSVTLSHPAHLIEWASVAETHPEELEFL